MHIHTHIYLGYNLQIRYGPVALIVNLHKAFDSGPSKYFYFPQPTDILGYLHFKHYVFAFKKVTTKVIII